MTGGALRILLVFGVALGPLPVAAERWLWTSPTGDTEVVDQSQTTFGLYTEMQNGLGIGQSFLPTAARLERLDLMLFNRHDRRPFTIRLWEWVDSNANGRADDAEFAATVARAALWSDRLALAGPPERQLVPFYPRIAVRAGVPHYFELSNDTSNGEFTAYASLSTSVDPYTRGHARLNGRFQASPNIDLWFKTYGSPAGAPAALTCEDTGAPAPCFSTPSVWFEPAIAGPPPAVSDYRQIVQSYANYARPYVLAGNGSNGHEFAFYEAFLYRVTKGESYAASALAMLDRALAWREASLNGFYSLFWGEYPGWAYRWIQASPTLDAAAHARIRRLLVLHGIGLWPQVEAGMQNHALASALTMKLVTDLVPASEFAAVSGGAATSTDHAAWKAFADAMWAEFKQRFDIWEDASQYHYFELRHILELAELYGEQSVLWSSPGFRTLVDRGFAVHTALGPHPPFGDTLGWNESWGTAVWVFEAAARWLREPQYRWLAARVFDYQRSHLRSTRLDGTPIALWQAVYNEYLSFVFAFFARDETAPFGAPPGFERIPAARQDAQSGTTWPSGTTAIGQTFVAEATPLTRIELQLRGPQTPIVAEIRLWPWNGTRSQTIAAPPLYAERFTLATAGAWRQTAFDLLVDVDVGATYFVEVRPSASSFDMAGSSTGGVDRYPAGDLWLGSERKTGADLWFRTSTFGGRGSAITDRYEAVYRRPTQFGVPPRPMDFTGPRVLDKLVLRSGWEPESLGLVVQLASGDLYHGQEETGAVLALTDDGALILADGTVLDRIDQRQAAPIVRRYTGARRDVVPKMSVPHFRDVVRATVAHLTWGERDGWPIDLERRFLFVKDRFVLVRDHATFQGPVEASIGPLWNAYDLDPEHGSTWFDLYYRQPLVVNGYRFANPERSVLLWTVPRSGVAVESWREVRTGNPPSPSYFVAQRWNGTAVVGDERWFDSLLLPHGPERPPAQAASDVTVLYDDGAALALRVLIDDETWTVVDNPEHVPIASALVTTDARYAVTRTRAGEPDYVFAHDATYVRVNDGRGRMIDRSWLVPSSAEIGTDWLRLRGGRGPSVRPVQEDATGVRSGVSVVR